jgi:hypothetical protein
MGYDAKTMLIGDVETKKYAVQRLRSHAFKTTRCILMGMVGVAAAVRIIDLEAEAVDEYKKSVQNGREPLLTGVKERVVRFIGEQSDVTDLSMRIHGQHIIPVVEHPPIEHGTTSEYETLIEHFTKKGQVPSCWRIKDGRYGNLNVWKGFEVDEEWLLETGSGRKVLVIEADSSPRNGCLSSEEMGMNDLDHYEVTQGCYSVAALAQEQGVVPESDNVLRVLLCDQTCEMVMGGNTTYNFREYVDYLDEQDVIIDSLQPVLAELLAFANSAWARNEHPPDRKKTLVFDTVDQEAFGEMQTQMGRHGWKVIDRPKKGHELGQSILENEDVPWVVYTSRVVYTSGSTTNTINTIKSMLGAGMVKPDMVCALLENEDGLQKMNALGELYGCQIPSVCSAIIYDALFAEVRQLARRSMATTKTALKAEIQGYMDDHYNYAVSPRPVNVSDCDVEYLEAKLARKRTKRRDVVRVLDGQIEDLQCKIKERVLAEAKRSHTE